MDIFRDVVIVIFCLVYMIVLIISAVLLYLVYRRVMTILKAAKAVGVTFKGVSGYVRDEIAEPLVQLAAVVQGVSGIFTAAGRMFGGGRKDSGNGRDRI